MSAPHSDRSAAGPHTLILGGTAEARALAAACVGAGLPVLSSLAGRVSNPALPVGPVRIGGFGGVAGLTDHLHHHPVTAVVDATHPFAATMSASAATACTAAGIPLLRLARPGWSDRSDAADWHWVDDTATAAAATAALGTRIFLTTGRQTLGRYRRLEDRYVLARVVESPTEPLPARWELIRDRGPYELGGELALMRSRSVDVLVTKDSGGVFTQAKLEAAAALRLAVVVIRRPPDLPGVRSVGSVALATQWLSTFNR